MNQNQPDSATVELFPDDRADPHSWRSLDAGCPEVTIQRGRLGWEARLERRMVLSGRTPSELADGLYHEYGFRAVLREAEAA